MYKYERGMVPGLANRNGRHNVAEGRNIAGWGGVWIKNMLIANRLRSLTFAFHHWLHANSTDRTRLLLLERDDGR